MTIGFKENEEGVGLDLITTVTRKNFMCMTMYGGFGEVTRLLHVDEAEKMAAFLNKWASTIRAAQAGQHDTDDEKVAMAIIDEFNNSNTRSGNQWAVATTKLRKLADMRRGA